MKSTDTKSKNIHTRRYHETDAPKRFLAPIIAVIRRQAAIHGLLHDWMEETQQESNTLTQLPGDPIPGVIIVLPVPPVTNLLTNANDQIKTLTRV